MKKKTAILLALLCLVILLGAVLVGKPYISRALCVGCGDCVKHCPVTAISMEGGRAIINSDVCIDCGICVKTCNYNAVRRPK